MISHVMITIAHCLLPYGIHTKAMTKDQRKHAHTLPGQVPNDSRPKTQKKNKKTKPYRIYTESYGNHTQTLPSQYPNKHTCVYMEPVAYNVAMCDVYDVYNAYYDTYIYLYTSWAMSIKNVNNAYIGHIRVVFIW